MPGDKAPLEEPHQEHAPGLGEGSSGGGLLEEGSSVGGQLEEGPSGGGQLAHLETGGQEVLRVTLQHLEGVLQGLLRPASLQPHLGPGRRIDWPGMDWPGQDWQELDRTELART